MLVGAVVMLIMMYIAYREYRGVGNSESLLSVIYRDGILYFVSLSGELATCSRML